MDKTTKKVVNLTPHAINFVTENGAPVCTIEPSGSIARVSCSTVKIGEINGIPVTANEYGEVEGLPLPEEGTIYLVSSLVAGRCPDRKDVFIPNEPVRNEKGMIVGCKSFGRV